MHFAFNFVSTLGPQPESSLGDPTLGADLALVQGQEVFNFKIVFSDSEKGTGADLIGFLIDFRVLSSKLHLK